MRNADARPAVTAMVREDGTGALNSAEVSRPRAAEGVRRNGSAKWPQRSEAFKIRTCLCRHSNQSLFASENSVGKGFDEARDSAGIFWRHCRFRAAETTLSPSSVAKPWKVKDYSDGAGKPELRKTA